MGKISVADLSFRYGARIALQDVSIQMEERQITALIGPSGCGKSTFLRCLNRMNDTIPGAFWWVSSDAAWRASRSQPGRVDSRSDVDFLVGSSPGLIGSSGVVLCLSGVPQLEQDSLLAGLALPHRGQVISAIIYPHRGDRPQR